MATNDQIAEVLRATAANELIPVDLLQEATRRLTDAGQNVGTVLSETSRHYSPIMGAMGEALGEIDNAIAACEQLRLTLNEAANAHQTGG